jgi:methionyl-tRNA formyltransferase
MGSHTLSIPFLEAIKDMGVRLVVTTPDKASGRGLKITPSVVKAYSERNGLAVITPSDINSPEMIARLKQEEPELGVVVAYGQILKPEILNLFPLGCINVHASLLPKYRGAAPIQWAIANGEKFTGITIIFMNEKMDAGDILLQKTVEIRPDDTAQTLQERLSIEGPSVLIKAIELIASGNPPRISQTHSEATFAPRLKKEDGKIDWNSPAEVIERRVRAFNPWPCCYTRVVFPEGKQHTLKIFKVAVENKSGLPGEILDVQGDGPLVATGHNSVRLLSVQPEGKRQMTGKEYLQGYKLQSGMRLG